MGLLKLLKLDVENEGLGKQVLITTVGYVVCYLEPQMNKSIGSDVKTDSWFHGNCVRACMRTVKSNDHPTLIPSFQWAAGNIGLRTSSPIWGQGGCMGV